MKSILRFSLALGLLAAAPGPALAQPTADFATCTSPLSQCDYTSGIDNCCYRDFNAVASDRAIIIPMDRCHQPIANGGKLAPPTDDDDLRWCRKSPGDAGVGGNSFDDGMYHAYGLVYRLMQNDIDVYWIVNPTKDPIALTNNDNLSSQTYLGTDVDMWALSSGASPPSALAASSLQSCTSPTCTAPVLRVNPSTMVAIAGSYDRKEFPVRGAFVIAAEDRAEFNDFIKRTGSYSGFAGDSDYDFSLVDMYELQASASLVYQDFTSAAPSFTTTTGAPVAVRIDYDPPRLARLSPAGVSEIWLDTAKLLDPANGPGCKSGTFVPADAVFCDVTESDIQAGVLVSGSFEWAWIDNWSDNSPCGTAAELTQHSKLDEFMTHQPGVRAGGSVMFMEAAVGVVESCPNMQFQGTVGATGGLADDSGGVSENMIIRWPQNLFLQMSDVPPEFASGAVGNWYYHTNGATGYSSIHTDASTGSLKRLLTMDRAVGANTTCTYHKSTASCDVFAQSANADYQDMGTYVRHKSDPENGIAFYMGGNNVNGQPSHLRVVLNSLIAVPFATVDQEPNTVTTEVSRSSPIVATVDGIEAQYQGTYEYVDPPPSVTTYIGAISDATFEFPYVKGHLRATDTSGISTSGDQFSTLSEVFDAADGIPPVNASGCGSNFSSSCRTVFTNVTSGLIRQQPGGANVPFMTTGNAGTLQPFLGSSFTTAETETLISRILAGVNDNGSYVAKLGGVDRSTLALIEASPLAGSSRPTIAYFGALDGMLHAVCADVVGACAAKGQELWAFIPRTQLGRLALNTQRIDGSPKVADMYGDFDDNGTREWRTILSFQTGSGDPGFANLQPSVFGIDITDPAAPILLWEVTTPDVRGTVELGQGIGLAMGPVRIGGANSNVVFAETNNGGTGNSGIYLMAIDAEDGSTLWETDDTYIYTQPPRSVGTDPPVPATGIPGGVAAFDLTGSNTLTHVAMPTLYGELYLIDAATGANEYGTDPLFQFEGNYHPIGAAPTIYHDSSTGKLHAIVVSGGYADPVNSSWAPSTVEQFAVSVALDASTTPMLDTGGDYGGERAFVISLGVGNRAFAQALVAGNELFIVTDSGDVNSSTYGTTGAQTGNLSRYSLNGGTAITVNSPLAGGASGADYRNGSVYTGAADKAQKQTLNNFDATGTTAELVFQSKTGRQLWLRLR